MWLDARVRELGGDQASARRRARTVVVAVGLAVATLGMTVAVGRSLEPAPAAASSPNWVESLVLSLSGPTTTTTTAPKPKPKPATPAPEVTWLATPYGTVPTFDAPGGRAIGSLGYWYGWQVTTPVIGQRGSWFQVRLPERPNGSTAWVRSKDVKLTTSAYRIVVHRDQASLTLYKDGYPVFTVPAGLGKAATPTPLGGFFAAVVERPGPPGYGSVVVDTTANSEVINSWEGTGDAVIAIHGPISRSADAQIGSHGAYLSNGCIRLHPSDQDRLAPVPVGTPIDIVP